LAGGNLTNSEKINVLLKEYDGLRAEIRSRGDNQFSLLGFAGLVLTWLFSHPAGLKLRWEIAILAPPVLLMYFLLLQAIKRCANRLIVIEAQINALAGEHLLEWEIRWGYLSTNTFRSRPKNWKLETALEEQALKSSPETALPQSHERKDDD
jgi:hypothetical protein